MCSIFIEELKRSARREIGAKCGAATSAGWSPPLLLLRSALCSTLYCFVLQYTDYVMCYHMITLYYQYTHYPYTNYQYTDYVIPHNVYVPSYIGTKTAVLLDVVQITSPTPHPLPPIWTTCII